MITQNKLIITPQTKVKELLDAYPELEPVLIDMAPAFKKLRNPVLRRTIARVTSIKQAAAVGDIPIDQLVNKLRGLVGQDELADLEDEKGGSKTRPDWVDEKNILKTFDAKSMIASGGHPLTQVLQDLQGFENGRIYLLITPFLPAPLLDKVREQGYDIWTDKKDNDLFLNYFIRN